MTASVKPATQFSPANGQTFVRRSTITDVARVAGVSIKTVSRVVRKEPNVNEMTRAAVEKVIGDLNYRPTISARSTTSARSYLMGLVFDNPNPSYVFELLSGVQRTCKAHGYHLIFEPLDSTKSPDEALGELVIQGNLEGIILPPPLCDDAAVLKAMERLGRPFARIAPGSNPDVGLCVAMDDRAAAHDMTKHLIALGHRRIAFILGREGTATTRRRFEGYQDALIEANLGAENDLTCQGNFLIRSGADCAEHFLDLPNRPTAIFASNDEMAAGVLIACHRRGLRVPEDISVVGFDDSEIASAMWPPLTTVRQPVAALAAAAAERLIEYQREPEGHKLAPVTLDYELILRESSGPAPARQ